MEQALCFYMLAATDLVQDWIFMKSEKNTSMFLYTVVIIF